MCNNIYIILSAVNLKSRLSCVVAWKAYAPTIMMGSEDDLSERRIVMVKKLGVVPISGRS